MGRFFSVDGDTVKAAQDQNTKAFERLMAQYNDTLADKYAEPAAAPPAPRAAPSAEMVNAAPVPAVIPDTVFPVSPALAAPAAPTLGVPRSMAAVGDTVQPTNPRQLEKAFTEGSPPVMLGAEMGGGVSAESLKSHSTYAGMSFAGRRKVADFALQQARGAMTKDKVPVGSINATMTNLRREYDTALGPAPARGAKGAADDVGAALGRGFLGTIKAGVDTTGAGASASKYMQGMLDETEASQSPQRKDELKFQQEEAAALGKNPNWLDRGVLALHQAGRNPGMTLAEGVGGMIPFLGAGVLGAGSKLMVGLSALVGTGAVKGGIYDAVKKATPEQLMGDPAFATMLETNTTDEAKEKYAVLRQLYENNLPAIAAGTVMGGVAGKLSPSTQLAAALSKKYTPDQLTKMVSGGLVKAIAKGAAVEVPVNAIQEGAETILSNVGAAGKGANIAWDTGVIEAAVQAGMMSLGPGVASSAAGRGKAKAQINAALRQTAIAAAQATTQAAQTAAAAAAINVTPSVAGVPPAPPTPNTTTPPVAPPAGAGPFAAQYLAMGVSADQLSTMVTIQATDAQNKPVLDAENNPVTKEVPLTEIDAGRFEELAGLPLSWQFDGAIDTVPANTATAAQIDTTPPYADVPGPVREAAAPPTEQTSAATEPRAKFNNNSFAPKATPVIEVLDTVLYGPSSGLLEAAIKKNGVVDIAQTPGITPEQVRLLEANGFATYGHMDAAMLARAKQAAGPADIVPRIVDPVNPRQRESQGGLDTAHPRQRESQGGLSAWGDTFVDDNGQPIGAQQAAENIVAKLEKSFGPTEAPVVEPPVVVPPAAKLGKAKAAPAAKATKLAPASKKKVADSQETTDADARTSADAQRREGQAALVEGADNTAPVAGQKAGAAERVGDDLQSPASTGGKAEASTGRSGAGTAGAEPSAVAGGKLAGSRLSKPAKATDAERTANAVAAWDEAGVSADHAVPYDSLGPAAKKSWTDSVAFKMDTDARKTYLSGEATRLSRQSKDNARSKATAKKAEAENARGERDGTGKTSERTKVRIDATDPSDTDRAELRGATNLGDERSALERSKAASDEVDHPAIREAAKTGNAETLLDAISKTDLTPDQRVMVESLKGKLGGVTVKLAPEGKPGFDPKTRAVTVSNGSAESALHEVVHAGTIDAITDVANGRGTPEQTAAVNELAHLQRVIETEGKLGHISAFDPASYAKLEPREQAATRAAEIVAEAQANPKAARALARITGDGESMGGVQRLVAAVRDLLGMKPSADSALAKVLRLSEPLVLKSEPGPNALENSGFVLSNFNRLDQGPRKPNESMTDYLARAKLVVSRVALQNALLSMRPNETASNFFARKLSAYIQPIIEAERGHAVFDKKGAFIDGFYDKAAAEALQAQHPGSRIDTKASVFPADQSIAALSETMANKGAYQALTDNNTYITPITQKLAAFAKQMGGKPRDFLRDINSTANALTAIEVNESGRRESTPLTELAEAKRRAILDGVKQKTIATSTGWRALKVLTDNPANRALDAAGAPVPLKESHSGITDAEAKEILDARAPFVKFLTVDAHTELEALRDRNKELAKQSLQFDARGMAILEMRGQKNYFPLYGEDGGALVDVPRGFASTETTTLHTREGRSGLAHEPFNSLLADNAAHHARIVEVQRGQVLQKLVFTAARNNTAPTTLKARAFLDKAGVKYVKSDVLDALDHAKNANEATQGSSKTIITRRAITGGSGKVQQVHVSVNEAIENGQSGTNFIAAWSGANIAQPPSTFVVLNAIQRTLTGGATHYDPRFAPYDLVRTHFTMTQLIAGDFGISAAGNYAKQAAVFNPIAIMKAMAGAKDADPVVVALLADARAAGVLTQFYEAHGVKRTASLVKARLGRGSTQTALDAIEFYNEAFEWSPRLAAMAALKEHGVGFDAAGLWALKTANFSMQGEWTPWIRPFVGFFNPGMQGIRRMGEVVNQAKSGNHRMKAVVAVTVAAAAAAYIMSAGMLGKDEEGEDVLAKMHAGKSYRAIYVPNPMGGNLLAIPYPIDWSPISGLGIAAARVALGHTDAESSVAEWAKEALQRLSPAEVKGYHGLWPQLAAMFAGGLRPYIEVGFNQNGLGIPISKDHERTNKLASLNGKETTPQAYKSLMGLLSHTPASDAFSPEDLRHVFTSYFPGVTGPIDAMLHNIDETLPARKNNTSLIPLVGRFVTDRPESDSRFYEIKEKARAEAKDFNREDTEAARAADPNGAATADLWKQLDKDEKKLAKETKALNQTPKDKKAEVLEKRNRIHDDFIRRYREINK